MKDTGERLIPGDPAFNYSFQHHLVAYEWAKKFCAGKDVLDVGCGQGYGCNILSENATSVVGVDKSAEAISLAKELYKHSDVKFVAASAYELPFAESSFDIVCCFQVIEHLKYPEKLLALIKKLLKPGGILIISTPNKIQFGQDYSLKIPFHYKEFEPNEFRDLIDKYFVKNEIYGLWGDDRISELHNMDKQAVLKLVKMDPLKIRKAIPRKFYELVYPYFWKKSRTAVYKQHKKLIDSINVSDFKLEILNNKPSDKPCWDIYAVAHNS